MANKRKLEDEIKSLLTSRSINNNKKQKIDHLNVTNQKPNTSTGQFFSAILIFFSLPSKRKPYLTFVNTYQYVIKNKQKVYTICA